jgi:predicted component of type VI protein secretion system
MPTRSEAGSDGDGTRRIGSLVAAGEAGQLVQLRSDGSVRDVFHLADRGAVPIGRDTGDWTFAHDQTMSARHAEIRAADGAFTIEDLGSRNGVAVAARGERLLRPGARLLTGDQVMRVERI